jgi:hypothetical protein
VTGDGPGSAARPSDVSSGGGTAAQGAEAAEPRSDASANGPADAAGDAASDPASDAARDAAPDAAPDAARDAAPDAARDAAVEVVPDAAAEAAPGAAPLPSRPARAPEQTTDDTDVGWGQVPESADAHERWLLEQRPPHWD